MPRLLTLLALSLLLPLLLPACEASSKTTSAGSPSSKSTAPGSSTSKPAEQSAAATLHGRWKGSRACLELYRSGDFTLSSMRQKGGKVVITGSADQRRLDSGEVELRLRPDHIQRHRFVGKCRKQVIGAKSLDSYTMLDVKFSKTEATVLRVRRLPDGLITLCGKQCDERMKVATPYLHGRWSKPGMKTVSKPEVAWTAGELIHIRVKGDSLSLVFGGASGDVLHADTSTAEVTAKPDGSFEISATIGRVIARSLFREVAEPVTLLGAPIAKGTKLTLVATRMKGWHLKVCRQTTRCVDLSVRRGR